MRREVTVELSSQGFWKTGIRSDVCQVTPLNCMHAHTAPIPWIKHTNVHIVSQHNALVLLKVKRFKTSFNALQRDKYKQSFITKIYIFFLTRQNRILNKDYFNYRLFFCFNAIVKRKKPIFLKFKKQKIPKFKKLKAQSVEHFRSRMKESTL